MSKSFKGEAKAQARVVQQRRAARAAKHADNFHEWGDSKIESPRSERPSHNVERWTQTPTQCPACQHSGHLKSLGAQPLALIYI
jgi:hypothetical protein